ncbi:IS701 family transposase [Calothrix sp. 336/3]|uniref:IS701 family transposase n=1 Tax=Calothrix sp. 336/3 TaxID=1337936 RepID=UPI0004E3F441|nr:IS701 family transposase [Calothrix sp. 336/3]AKG23005.1 transposase [Calothrix sp. 336/3]AKG23041.1 transposase [Calothrix sp. 336/3]AKG23937.1 transposase [Calothrix sp. 336/3]AKG24325.1 transposase [Calothrix sp. 336/3]AKG24872.1 transposase [Calothrix sp. 336/3]
MVTPRRQPVSTVAFIDNYCQHYYSVFEDVRHFEAFKFLHLGIVSEIPRKTLPLIAKTVGLKDSQTLHHFLRDALWDVKKLREIRLWLIKRFIGEREIILCIDETGDKKKGKSTDYVTSQYIGNLGKTENGIVSVNAYGVVDGITYPLMFQIFKPRNRLREGDKYKSKPQIAIEIIQELKEWGFKIKLVLADSLYGESGDVIRCLEKLELEFIVAIRSNHGVLMPPGSRKRYNRWKAYEQKLSHRQTETRYLREIIFGKRRRTRYYQISKMNTPDPTGDESWYIMTNLSTDLSLNVAQLYSLRNWIEYGFKQVKNELGWADFRLTDYESIERWWEIIFSAYLFVSIQATYFQLHVQNQSTSSSELPSSIDFNSSQYSQHPNWESGTTWKSALNNLRLLIQPYIFYCLIQPWLTVFNIPGMKRCFLKLINFMNDFRASPVSFSVAS